MTIPMMLQILPTNRSPKANPKNRDTDLRYSFNPPYLSIIHFNIKLTKKQLHRLYIPQSPAIA